MLRSVAARWFELLVPRRGVARALETLAATGLVELEAGGPDDELIPVPRLDEPLSEFAELEHRYGKYWSRPASEDRKGTASTQRRDRLLEKVAERALVRVRAWRGEAKEHIDRIELLENARGELQQLAELCRACEGVRGLNFSDLVADSSGMQAMVFTLPAESETPRLADPILYRRVDTREAAWLLTFGRRDQVRRLAEALEGRHARRLALPDWLTGNPKQAGKRVARRLGAVERLVQYDRNALDRLNREHRIVAAVDDMRHVRWLGEHLEGIATSDYMARIRGWTSDEDGEVLRSALEQAGIPAALSFPPAPPEKVPPSLVVNPPWARPFELFAKLVGTPGTNEADPSVIVAFIAPVLFGYMFGDVGHGMSVLVLGLVLCRRFPATSILIWGGAWSIVFGVAFGAIFGVENVIPALWLHPVADPLPVLIVPLIGGAALISLSMLLNALEHAWAGRFMEWVYTQSAMLAALAFGMVSLIDAAFLPAFFIALVVQYAGLCWDYRRHGPSAFARGFAELAEGLLQLAVNTLSFIRVGAFALAHAGLSLAVVTLADGTRTIVAWLLVMLFGNALIIAIEGLVASIQTTRLMLFEFFNRFLVAGGRPFRPLAPPAH